MTEARISKVGACVFDAYGTLFDVNAAARQCRDALGDKAEPLSEIWRRKQLEYTWLRSLMGRHLDFWEVTEHALSYAMEALDLDDPDLHARMMQIYLTLDAYDDVRPTLTLLKETGIRLAILSNGSTSMLTGAVKNAGIHGLIDATLSVDRVGIYKPHPSVYELAVDALKLDPWQICFVSSNGWDVSGAAVFGFRVVWLNRFGQRREKLPGTPEAVVAGLAELPELLTA